MSRCTTCGRELPATGKFCPGCGATLAGAGTVASAPAAPGKGLFGFSRWDAGALIGGAISAGVWYYWSTLDKSAPQDGFTHLYILGFTAAVIFLRKQIDMLLMPIQALKQHIPRLVLIGVALALPYFLAHYFYKQGVSNYPLMHKSIVWGTILPYILLRIPENWKSSAGGGLVQAGRTHGWFLFAFVMLALFGDAGMVLADDFLRDVTRLEDGMRTPGWAETIAGTGASAINILVNGSLVFQQPGKPGKDGEESPQYTMDIRTEDKRTSIAADGEDRLWVYAKIMCSKPSVNAQGLTNAVSFTFGGSKYADWMSIKSTQSHSGYKAVLLACTPPSPEAEVEEDASVILTIAGTTADGQPMHGDVTLKLDAALEMKVDILA